ncbi:MAG: hypothetical protein GXO62_05630 [Epsilonproteobacteria bacterium]|nr:hypothetical protein [Campylobacterota bacterium]
MEYSVSFYSYLIYLLTTALITMLFIYFFYMRYKDVKIIDWEKEKMNIILGLFAYILLLFGASYFSEFISFAAFTLLEEQNHLQSILKKADG